MHFKNSVCCPATKKKAVCPHHACVVTSKPADMHHSTAKRERERMPRIISLSEQAPQELNPVLPSCAALRVSLDPSGRADVSRGKHGVAPNRQWQISHTALC